MENISLLTAIVAGILSFASPCVLPLIPAYISYISGSSLQEMKEGNKNTTKILINSIGFVIGFSIVFILLGASATYVGRFLAKNKRIFEIVSGSIVVIFGLHTAQIIKLRFLSYEKKVKYSSKSPSFISAILLGFAFSFGWTPCVGPILGTILIQASTYSTVKEGVFLLALYSLGLGVPFILTALAINEFFSAFKTIRNFFLQIEIFAGLLLLGLGLALVFGTGLHSLYLISIIGISLSFAFISIIYNKILIFIGFSFLLASLLINWQSILKIISLPLYILALLGFFSLYKIGVFRNERIKKA